MFGCVTVASEGLARELRLLETGERDGREFVWLWESPDYAVVMGRSSKTDSDVDMEACNAAGVPVLRRASGGGTVLLGPGCLNYALVLSANRRPMLHDVARSYQFILQGVSRAISLCKMNIEGSDLTVDGRKVAGCAQRRLKNAILHHGSILYDLDMGLVTRFLREPVRQPEHRRGRRHEQFLANVPITPDFPQRLALQFDGATLIPTLIQ